ncbi:MAG: hypothetical protein IJX69_04265 [Oscillospiraceae bacterium]|nr:hypothetical protein [Oscillospiraceae bacterium]
MKFWRAFIPNLSIVLDVALLVVIYLDRRNPMMGFLVGGPFLALAAAACVCSVITAVIVYGDWRKHDRRRRLSHDENHEDIPINIEIDS